MFVENVGYLKVGPGIDIQHMRIFMKYYGHVLDDWKNGDYYVRIGSPISVYQGTASSTLYHQFDTKTTKKIVLRPFPNAIGGVNIAWYINKGKSLVYICVQYDESNPSEELGFVTNTSNISRMLKATWGSY
jgi:hypothetical protein